MLVKTPLTVKAMFVKKTLIVKTATESFTFPRIFARRMAKSCLFSGRPWLRRSGAGTGLRCR